tara:strand:- start:74 stop:637 length:564 start_codon:yes stop_codon:yes gene_type:complete
MSSVKISGDTSGVITVAAPAVSGTNTITMPASTGTMALTSDITSGGLTLLATVNTTSGTSQSTSTISLTGYKNLFIDIYSVGSSGTAGKLQLTPNGGSASIMWDVSAGSSSQAMYGLYIQNLASGVVTSTCRSGLARSASAIAVTTGLPGPNTGVNQGLTTSTTEITFSFDGSEIFDVGQILVYGLS